MNCAIKSVFKVEYLMHTIEPIPGFPSLIIKVYGLRKATCLAEIMGQGYYLSIDGKPVARSELTSEQRAALENYLMTFFPEHASI